jgi:hypothetical protein
MILACVNEDEIHYVAKPDSINQIAADAGE